MLNLLNLIRIGNWELPWDLETGLFWLLVAQVVLIVFMVIVFAIIMHRVNKEKATKAGEDELTGISVDTHAVKQQFTVGDEFTCEGLVVVAHYKNGVDKIAVDYEILPPDLSQEGESHVDILLGEQSTSYTVSVVQPENEPTPAEETVEEPVEKPVEEPVPEPILEEPAEEPEEGAAIFMEGVTRYNKSFTAKLIQSDDVVKSWYNELRNELLSYKKVKSRRSWKRESYHFGRQNIVRFAFRGKTLCVYFALDYSEFEGSKYKIETVEDSTSYADTPCLYRIKNDRRVRYAKDLIAIIMERVGAERNEEYVAEDISIPYEETEALIDKGLIKVNGVARQIVSQDTSEEAAIAAVSEGAGDGSAEEPVVEETTEEPVVEDETTEEPVVEETTEEPVVEDETTEEPVVEEEAAEEPVVEEEATEEPVVEEEAAEEPAVEEEATEEPVVEEEATEEPVVEEEATEEPVVEEEATEEPAVEAEVEELSTQELDDVRSYEEKEKDEDGIEVVGVMFRHRGKKVYWFDPNGKTWEKGEIALYITPDVSPQEVIVVDNAKISPSKLHLPLKPLHKATIRPQSPKKK